MPFWRHRIFTVSAGSELCLLVISVKTIIIFKWSVLWKIIIIIMYIYHALINALSTCMIHINLNVMFYTHQVEHSPTKTTHTKQDTERQTPHLTPQHTQKTQFKRVQHWSVSYIMHTRACTHVHTHTHIHTTHTHHTHTHTHTHNDEYIDYTQLTAKFNRWRTGTARRKKGKNITSQIHFKVWHFAVVNPAS